MSFLWSNLEIFTLQIIVFCRFYGKVTVQLRTEEETGSGIDIIKCSFCDFLPWSWSGNFLHMKSRKSLLLESGILALESGIQLKKSRITAWIQNPRLSWIHNKDTANYQKKGAFCQMWKSFFMWSTLWCIFFDVQSTETTKQPLYLYPAFHPDTCFPSHLYSQPFWSRDVALLSKVKTDTQKTSVLFFGFRFRNPYLVTFSMEILLNYNLRRKAFAERV